MALEEDERRLEGELMVIELRGDQRGVFPRPRGELLQRLRVLLGEPDELSAKGEVLLIDPVQTCEVAHSASGSARTCVLAS